jgi:hypothetical protein
MFDGDEGQGGRNATQKAGEGRSDRVVCVREWCNYAWMLYVHEQCERMKEYDYTHAQGENGWEE